MTEPHVDVIIPVHSRTRPIARAAASVLDHTVAPVRVNVVAHNIDPEIIRENLGSVAEDPRLRLLHLEDGIPSPAGPMNHGIVRSTAPFITVMGSDDEFAPGAIDSWLELQGETGAEAVIARIQVDTGRTDPFPPTRNGRRTRELDSRKDRLVYRSAPLGLVDRRRFGELRFTEGLPSGEDLCYSMTLWFTGRRIAYDLQGPPYVINADAEDRVTSGPRPLAEDFAFLDELESLPWFQSAGRAKRVAIVAKLIKIHIFDAILARCRTQESLDANRAGILALVDRFERIAPGTLALLSRAERAAFDELRKTSSTPESVGLALEMRYFYDRRHPIKTSRVLLPRNPLLALHRQAPIRLYAATLPVINGKV